LRSDQRQVGGSMCLQFDLCRVRPFLTIVMALGANYLVARPWQRLSL